MYHEFDYDGQSSIAIHNRTKTVNAKHHISLFKIENDNGKHQYVYITDYDKLIGKHTNHNDNTQFHCRYCLHGYKRQDLLNAHLHRGCLSVEGRAVRLPKKEDDDIEFKNAHRKYKCHMLFMEILNA